MPINVFEHLVLIEVLATCIILLTTVPDASSYSYVLPLPKAQAVAQETLAVWCSLASRLGVWALKAELEDLCFAVLQVCSLMLLQVELFSCTS